MTDQLSGPTMRCKNGHGIPAGQAFCGFCGERAAVEQQPRSRKKYRLIAAVCGVLAVVVGSAVAFAVLSGDSNSESGESNSVSELTTRSSRRPERSIKGSFELIDYETANNDCDGTGGYSDIGNYMQVTVKDESGKIIGSTTASEGEVVREVACRYDFTVPDLPKARFYELEIGSGRRGNLRYSYDEMVSRDWEVDVSLS